MPTALHGHQVAITLLLLALLGAVFLRGFTEAIGIAVALVATYLLLNVVVIAVSLWHIASRPSVIGDWTSALTTQHGDPLMVVALSLLVFPKLALGMSGFETGVAVMTHVRGERGDTEERPAHRIRRTKRMLAVAAVIMSVFLVTSSFVTTLLIPADEFQARRAGVREGARLPGARLPRQRLRHGVRRQHDRHPLVRRRICDGRDAEPDPEVPPSLRDGTSLGARRSPARARAHCGGFPGDLDLRCGRQRPGWCLRHGGSGPVHLGGRSGHPRCPTGGSTPACDRVRGGDAGVRLHHPRQRGGASRRGQDRRLLHRRHPGGVADLATLAGLRAAGHRGPPRRDCRAVPAGLLPSQHPVGRQRARRPGPGASTTTSWRRSGSITTCRTTSTWSSSRSR